MDKYIFLAVVHFLLNHASPSATQSIPNSQEEHAPNVYDLPTSLPESRGTLDGTGSRTRTRSETFGKRDPEIPEGFLEVYKIPADKYSGDTGVNLTMFDMLIEDLLSKENTTQLHKTECELRNILAPDYFNFTTDSGEKYCPAYHDEIQCWKESAPGRVYRPCPSSFRGIKYDTNGTVVRVCNEDGTWGARNKSDYSNCTPIVSKHISSHDPYGLTLLHTAGCALSFFTTLGALIILFAARSLWCVRNYIHMNFLFSFFILYLVLFGGILSVHTGDVDLENWQVCLLKPVTLAATLANFCWMLVEGVYLFTIMVRGVMVRNRTLWLYAAIGWVVPVGVSLVYALIHFAPYWKIDNQHWTKDCLDSTSLDYIVIVPIMLIITINVYFMIHIIVVIVKGTSSSTSGDIQQLRKGLRALIVLTPLLGAIYLLFLVQPAPEHPTAATYAYRYLLTFLQSTQGFFVALIYVFLNPEVHRLLQRKFMSWRDDTTIFTHVPRNELKSELSNTIPLQDKGEVDEANGTTTLSHNYRNGKANHGNGELAPLRSTIAKKSGENADAGENGLDKRHGESDLEYAALIGGTNGYIHGRATHVEENNNNNLVKT